MRRLHEHGRGGFLLEKRVAEQRGGLGRVAGGGLLEEDVLACLEGAEGPLVVEGRGGGDVDARDGNVIEDFLGNHRQGYNFFFGAKIAFPRGWYGGS